MACAWRLPCLGQTRQQPPQTGPSAAPHCCHCLPAARPVAPVCTVSVMSPSQSVHSCTNVHMLCLLVGSSTTQSQHLKEVPSLFWMREPATLEQRYQRRNQLVDHGRVLAVRCDPGHCDTWLAMLQRTISASTQRQPSSFTQLQRCQHLRMSCRIYDCRALRSAGDMSGHSRSAASRSVMAA